MTKTWDLTIWAAKDRFDSGLAPADGHRLVPVAGVEIRCRDFSLSGGGRAAGFTRHRRPRARTSFPRARQ